MGSRARVFTNGSLLVKILFGDGSHSPLGTRVEPKLVVSARPRNFEGVEIDIAAWVSFLNEGMNTSRPI